MAISFIKWSGSKRLQAKWIVDKFPSKIKTYYEPFLGSGSVMIEYLSRYPNSYCIASDICQPLIALWKAVQTNPKEIIDAYTEYHHEFNSKDIDYRKEYFNKIRDEFNKDQSLVANFLFLSRTCINGLIRFNRKGIFNSTPHFTRPGIEPNTLKGIIEDCHTLIQNVEFNIQSYDANKPEESDLVYLDPPYAFTKTMYYGAINLDNFFNYVSNINCNWMLSFDGKVEGEEIYQLPIEYKNCYFYSNSLSTFKKVIDTEERNIQEALYLNYISEQKMITIDDFF